MIIHKRVNEDANFKYHWRCEKTAITHLCFADDLMLFCGNSFSSAHTLKQALQDFSALSGLEPNHSKSSIFIAGKDDHYKRGILNIFGFPEDSLPMRYLGVPLITTRLTSNDCKSLVDRMVARVKSWTSKFLSYAGRLQLIQSVLFSIQVYWTSIFILPKKVIKQVD